MRAYVAVRRVQQMGERRLAHPRRPNGDSGRVRPRWHPQIPLERLVQEERAELLASPQKIMQVRQFEFVIYLKDKSSVSDYLSSVLQRCTSAYVQLDLQGQVGQSLKTTLAENPLRVIGSRRV